MPRLLDAPEIDAAIDRIAMALLADLTNYDGSVIVGIKTRGAHIAERLAARIEARGGGRLPLGTLDISLYRDDHTELSDYAVLNGSDIPFPLRGKHVVLVDDILNSGRTALAALKAMLDMGRPASVRLACLLYNAQGRELPVVPDYPGRQIALAANEKAHVRLVERDGVDEVEVVTV